MARHRAYLPSPGFSPQATLPVSGDGWLSARSDCELDDLEDRLQQLLEEINSASEARSLHAAAEGLVAMACRVARDTQSLAVLQPAKGGEVVQLRDRLIACCESALDGDLSTAFARAEGVSQALLAIAALPGDEFDDACDAAFGVPYDSLRDSRGTYAPSRLFAAYYGRYDELADRVAKVLAPITDKPPHLINAVQAAESLIVTPRPLLTLRAASDATLVISQELSTDPKALAAPLRELKLRVDRSAANHAGIVRTTQALNEARTDAERAELWLDLYRRMVEGQLRPWAWTLLRIRGKSDEKPPDLNGLRELLVADGLPLLQDAADAILPAARNAAAHEDFEWDEAAEVVRIGDAAVTVAELEDGVERAYAFMCGAEAAWACARARWPQLATLLDADDPPNGLKTINVRSALSHFGTNGLRVHDWQYERGVLAVTIDELPFSLINPCFQAAAWASRYLEDASRVKVLLPSLPRPAADLSRQALDATFVVWTQARACFAAMPLSTFLPANADARLQVELPDEAALAAAWLAVNDAVHAYNEAHNNPGAQQVRVAKLALRLDLVGAALAATIAILPPQSVDPLREALDLALAAATRAGSVARADSPCPSASFEMQFRTLHERWPVPAVMPTVDSRPLAALEAKESSRSPLYD